VLLAWLALEILYLALVTQLHGIYYACWLFSAVNLSSGRQIGVASLSLVNFLYHCSSTGPENKVSAAIPLQAVFDYVDLQHQAASVKPGTYNLVNSYPRKVRCCLCAYFFCCVICGNFLEYIKAPLP
jgi:hypothetical protein